MTGIVVVSVEIRCICGPRVGPGAIARRGGESGSFDKAGLITKNGKLCKAPADRLRYPNVGSWSVLLLWNFDFWVRALAVLNRVPITTLCSVCPELYRCNLSGACKVLITSRICLVVDPR